MEDSIDDLISLLNYEKTHPNFGSLKEPSNLTVAPEIHDINTLLNMNSSTKPASRDGFGMGFKETKGVPLRQESRNSNASTSSVSMTQTKTDMITRNFLKTQNSYINQNNFKDPAESTADQDEIDLTIHPKMKIVTPTRCLIFQPILKEMKRPKTPPDNGYYFKFAIADVKLIRYLLEENGFKETNNNYNYSIYWSSGPIKTEVYQCLSYYQKVNHFPKSSELTRKDHMHRNISKMQTNYGLKNFNFIPKSFILPAETPLLESDAEKNRGTWYIVKPQASSQGRGIFITDRVEEIIAKQNQGIIVSHYINDPYLINGLKFDLRVYVCVTSIHPLRIYVYKEGLVRFATVPYVKEADSYMNRFVHLTNYSINKKSDTYVQNDNNEDEESCSKWTFATFRKYFEAQGINYDQLFARMEDLIVKSMLSIESILFSASVSQVPQRHNCFELFGFDILLDSKLKPWLLEVNLSPSMAAESTLDLTVKSELLSDVFNLAGIIPLDQRNYYEPLQFGKNQNLVYGATVPNFDKKPGTVFTEEKNIENLTKEEKQIIRETNEEFERRGKFKRIFPAANVNDYRSFFEIDRPYNKLLRAVINHNLKKDSKKTDYLRTLQNPKKVG